MQHDLSKPAGELWRNHRARLELAKRDLQRAAELVPQDVAPRAALAIRRAIKSTDGAIRHAQGREDRAR